MERRLSGLNARPNDVQSGGDLYGWAFGGSWRKNEVRVLQQRFLCLHLSERNKYANAHGLAAYLRQLVILWSGVFTDHYI
jgi:hypothetical protein